MEKTSDPREEMHCHKLSMWPYINADYDDVEKDNLTQGWDAAISNRESCLMITDGIILQESVPPEGSNLSTETSFLVQTEM